MANMQSKEEREGKERKKSISGLNHHTYATKKGKGLWDESNVKAESWLQLPELAAHVVKRGRND